VERLLLTLADAEDNASQEEIRRDPPVLVSNEEPDAWPPRPWPPWEGDGDDDEDNGGRKHVNKTVRAHELANKIVEFERKLAQASLDLCASNLLISKQLANCHFQRHFSRSNRIV
jgi:endothelin-converting enzyme